MDHFAGQFTSFQEKDHITFQSLHNSRSLFYSCLIFFFWNIVFSPTLSAQTPSPPQPDNIRINFWGGYSLSSVRFLGKTIDSQTEILSFGYQREAQRYSNGSTLWYTADIVPYIHFEYPKRDENNRRAEVRGFGFSPFGLLWTKDPKGIFKPFVQTTGGFMLMQERFPTDKGRRLNYTFDISLGTNIELNKAVWLSFGYKFHHISNAQTGEENPGLDSNFLFLTFSYK